MPTQGAPETVATRLWLFGAVLFAVLAASASALAQSCSVERYGCNSGGGTSTNRVFSVSGSIGQSGGSGPMIAGRHALSGGFWDLAASAGRADAPWLSVVSTAAGQVTISWSPDWAGFVLQETSALSPPLWVNVTAGEATPVVVWATGGKRFYRLHKP